MVRRERFCTYKPGPLLIRYFTLGAGARRVIGCMVVYGWCMVYGVWFSCFCVNKRFTKEKVGKAYKKRGNFR